MYKCVIVSTFFKPFLMVWNLKIILNKIDIFLLLLYQSEKGRFAYEKNTVNNFQ